MRSVGITLEGIRFEWDPDKAWRNRRRHGVGFEVAGQAFFDPFLSVVDAGSEYGEARHAVVGMTERWALLFVVFVERQETIRIISARSATAAERRLYEAR